MKYINATYAARLKAQEEFECNNCGNCCTQCAPIDITLEDLQRLAAHFGKSLKTTAKRHCKPNPYTGRGLVIKQDRPCKFYDSKNKKCKIYESRPEVCRKHPFLSSEPEWSNSFMVPLHCKSACEIHKKMIERGEI